MTGADLRAIRLRLDMTQRDLATALGYSVEHWSRMETGAAAIERPELLRLALEALLARAA